MKKNSLTWATAGLSLALSLSLVTMPSMAEEHEHHDVSGHELQLNAGQKWQTDAPLRQAMAEIATELNTSLDGIHNNTLNGEGYETLAEQVNQSVAYMIENCQLEPQADAQLHIVIARLIDSAQQMQQSSDVAEKRKGAVQLVGALNNYATFFNDADFVRPVH